jgi:hypothetical protein
VITKDAKCISVIKFRIAIANQLAAGEIIFSPGN